ncbi:uncharacterized protein [Acropora muricata]|uniref:uncharacterized protein isoform X2 n=1 Tax=Acropora muricata TaxID=159855 RepID=UPI0034E3CAA6
MIMTLTSLLIRPIRSIRRTDTFIHDVTSSFHPTISSYYSDGDRLNFRRNKHVCSENKHRGQTQGNVQVNIIPRSLSVSHKSLFTGTQDGGTVITCTIMMGGGEPSRTETIRQTTMPTEIIQKIITIEGDGNQLTAEELKDIIAKHAGEIGSSEVVITNSVGSVVTEMLWSVVQGCRLRKITRNPKTYTTKVPEVKQTKTITETMRVVDDDGNIIKTSDPETDAAIMETIQRAKEEDPNAKITDVVITRTDEESTAESSSKGGRTLQCNWPNRQNGVPEDSVAR